MYVCMYVYMYATARLSPQYYICLFQCVYALHTHTFKCSYMYTLTHVPIHTYNTCIHTHIKQHTDIHTHTHQVQITKANYLNSVMPATAMPFSGSSRSSRYPVAGLSRSRMFSLYTSRYVRYTRNFCASMRAEFMMRMGCE